MGGCYRGGEGGRLSSEGQSDQREGVHRWGGCALPSGIVPWGSRPYPQTGQAPQCSPGVCPKGSRLCRAGRPPQVGTAPKCREPGSASLLLLKTVCAQILAEWAGGRVDECPHLLLFTSRRPATCSASPQLEAAKKAYHLACKEEKLAVTREMNSKTEQSVTPEQQKKLQDKVDKCKQDVQKVPAGLGSEGPWSGQGWQLRAWVSPSLCPGAYRRRRSMKRCWMKWAKPPLSTWRAWSKCLNSASNLRKSGWSSSRRCCWTSNVTST